MFFSVQDCLEQQGDQSSDCCTTAAKPKKHQDQAELCALGKLTDHPEAMPQFTIENVIDYLINRKENDCMRAEDWKSFKAGGYKLFKEGHVQKIMITQHDSVFGITCSCLPEMKKDRVYKIKINLLTNSSEVCLAECSCPAGRGPHGSCKHIAATLFALENFNTIREEIQDDDTITCTSKLQTWNQPRKRRLDSQPVNEISFKVEHYYCKPTRQSKELADPRPLELQKTTDEEKKAFIDNLKKLEISCGFLDLMTVAESYTVNDDTSPMFPLTPRSAQCKIKAQLLQECSLPPTFETLLAYGKKFIDMITQDDNQQKNVEKSTRRQSACKRWREERYLRLTASNFGRVLLRKSNYTKLAEEILYSKLPESVPSLKWGKVHEDQAFTQYLEMSSDRETVRKAGFYIGNPSFLGASPDGIVETTTSIKIIEIKCPYSFRDLTVEEACTKKGFYCALDDDKVRLKLNHLYYYQIQGTMGITGAAECDFVVWTPHSMNIETIPFDKNLWEKTMLPQLHDFYNQYMLPYILY